jgi:hypothetical protein
MLPQDFYNPISGKDQYACGHNDIEYLNRRINHSSPIKNYLPGNKIGNQYGKNYKRKINPDIKGKVIRCNRGRLSQVVPAMSYDKNNQPHQCPSKKRFLML